MKIDSTDRGGPNVSLDPNENGFGWVIMAGPEKQLTSMNKRDCSHWELYGCPTDRHDGRQTVKAVCADESDDSNCGRIFNGGVPETVIELPHECGLGRYALAVSMEVSTDHTLPAEMHKRLVKRGLVQPRVYDLTYDYDFSVLQGREDNQVQVRIDFSTDPYYWGNVVNTPAKVKRDMELEVDDRFDGDWKAYIHEKFHAEKRSTPDHELHILTERWFSATVQNWLDKMLKVEHEWTLVKHRIDASGA